MKNENWVDYKKIKSTITMEMILRHYGIFDKMKLAGNKTNSLVGCCPIHKGTNDRQFSVNVERNIYNCFGNCKSGGNVLDFVANMEKVSIHEAGALLQKWFLSDFQEPKRDNGRGGQKKLVREENRGLDPQNPWNKPLTFELKSLIPDHEFFKERGIELATVEAFGLGYCTKGMLKDRIAIPLHNEKGELVAYCGRAVTPELIEAEKYKQPPNFKKTLVVYNLNRQDPGEKVLILVESFISVWWFHQAGYKNTVALMGSSISDQQIDLISNLLGSEGKVILMFDNDESGEQCTKDCLNGLSSKLYVKTADFKALAKKPHQLTPDQLKKILK